MCYYSYSPIALTLYFMMTSAIWALTRRNRFSRLFPNSHPTSWTLPKLTRQFWRSLLPYILPSSSNHGQNNVFTTFAESQATHFPAIGPPLLWILHPPFHDCCCIRCSSTLALFRPGNTRWEAFVRGIQSRVRRIYQADE